jgi:Collagen triple helix repeat (20 copies)
MDGTDGADGAPGSPGSAGATGATGATGSNGGTGATGPTGPTGTLGSTGSFNELQSNSNTFAYNASTSLDVSTYNDWRQTDTLTGAITITLTNGSDCMQGTILCAQDATGRVITMAASGRTVKVFGTISSSPNVLVSIGYLFATVNGTAYLFIYPAAV